MKIFELISQKICPICKYKNNSDFGIICENNIYHTTYYDSIYIYRNNCIFSYILFQSKYYLIFNNKKTIFEEEKDITIEELNIKINKYIENLVFE